MPESMSACTAASECAAERELCELSITHVMPASMQPERGDQVADVDIVRAIVARESVVGGRHVFGDGAVRNDAAKLAFPRMAVRIDEPWNDDRVRGVDHLRLGWCLGLI